MEFWGIVAAVAVGWAGLSLALGLGIGRAVHIADVHRDDVEFIRAGAAAADRAAASLRGLPSAA